MSAEHTVVDLKRLLGQLLPAVGLTHESALVHLAQLYEEMLVEKQQLLEQCQAEEEAQAVQSISDPCEIDSGEQKADEVPDQDTIQQQEEAGQKSETQLSESRKKLEQIEEKERGFFY